MNSTPRAESSTATDQVDGGHLKANDSCHTRSASSEHQVTNVLFVCPNTNADFPPWRVCTQIMRYLDRQRFRTLMIAGQNIEGELLLNDDRHTIVKRLPLRSMRELLFSLPELKRFVREQRVDVIHANEDCWSLIVGLIVSRIAHKPLVVHYHATPEIYRGARRMLLKVGAGMAARNVGVSKFIAQKLDAARVNRTSFVVNGVDCQRFHPEVDGSAIRAEYGVADDEILVVQMARFWRPKRQEDLVRALALARAQAPKLKCLLVGWDDPRYQGPFASYREEIKELAKKLGVADRVILANARPDSAQIHAAADIFAFPSVDDPCALVVLEVLATGKPLVGANSGGTPEMIEDGVTGFLVPPFSVQPLAEILVKLALDPDLRRRIGQRARQAAIASYPLTKVADGFASIYESVLADRANRLPKPAIQSPQFPARKTTEITEQ